ncbi:tumor necrosis factor alpha-induced protein 2-like isoform X1 [Solea solea]|uniref:tumor necrosis factor alpha-induced protein 2-like isoform X1 n=2 Tax=Solea solea TaxID=90069 RepID=UPI00272B0383|nr:tumor necrosis factor alpha-induced protein 2-like isoform X1 [Solea solea]
MIIIISCRFLCLHSLVRVFLSFVSISRTRMRTCSGDTEAEGFRRNSLPGHNTLLAGGRWINGKFMKLFRAPKAQESANVTPPTVDGRRSPSNTTEEEEEPQTGSPSVIATFDQCLEDRLFSEASQNLREREELLFGALAEAEGAQRREEEVNSLAEDYAVLRLHILQTLQQSLSTVNTDALTSAVKAVHQEDKQDQLWKQRDGTPPGWRPGGWKEFHDEALGSLVKDRMDNPSTLTDGQLVGKSSIMADICSMGRQLLDDLQLVVGVVKTCYPPQTDICGFYIRLYHQAFSARLGKIADFVLEDDDCRHLLCWVNEYYPERVQKLHLGCEDCTVMGKLLPQELLEPLEEQYLSSRQGELMTYVGRILEEEKRKWNNGEEPAMEDGCYVSHVAYDIIQFIYGIVTSAAKVVGDVHKAQRITCKLNPLMQSFKVFQDEVMRLNRANSRAIVKANLGSVQQFRDVLEKNAHLFMDDVRRNCLSVLSGMKESAHAYLLLPVHDSLRPQYRKLGTSEWLNKGVFEKLLLSAQAVDEQLRGLKESCRQELLCQFHQDVTVEYVRRLLRGDVKLKDKERQNAAFAVVKNDAESLHALFVRMGSNQDWLKEILTKIAEVLKLQDVPAIQMQVASLGSAFPDLSEKHVSALLKLKTNISRADRKVVKETLSDTLRETGVAASHSFFSKVQVK